MRKIFLRVKKFSNSTETSCEKWIFFLKFDPLISCENVFSPQMLTTVTSFKLSFCIYKITFWKRELSLAKSRVSITVWKTWKGSRHYTPSHTPSWTVFHVLVFCTGYFIKETKNIFSRVPVRCRNTRGSLGELEIAWNLHSPCELTF